MGWRAFAHVFYENHIGILCARLIWEPYVILNERPFEIAMMNNAIPGALGDIDISAQGISPEELALADMRILAQGNSRNLL